MSWLAGLPWWVVAIAALACALGTAFLAFLALSAGTAYGTDYHVLSPAQRRMARLLSVGALAGALACAVLALALGVVALHRS
jgi:hypothetical protein